MDRKGHHLQKDDASEHMPAPYQTWGTLHILIKSAALPESQEFRTVSSSSGMIMSSSRVFGLLQFGMLLRHLSLKIGQDHLRKRSLQILVMFF